jgi:CRP-like cAMP-binding protein
LIWLNTCRRAAWDAPPNVPERVVSRATMHVQLDRARPSLRRTPSSDEAPALRALRLLRPLPLFDGVLGEEAEPAFAEAVVVSAPAGTVLFEAGQPGSMLYVVVSGRIRLLLGQGPAARALAVMGRGDTIGLAALLRGDLYPVTAVTVDEALLVGLPSDTVQRLMVERPAIAARLVGDMGAKLARFVRDIGGFTQRTARARVARMLLDLYRAAGPDEADLAYAEPKRTIASRLAMTPETLSRELHALSAQGLIDSRRTRFRVLDAAGLARAADDSAPAPRSE